MTGTERFRERATEPLVESTLSGLSLAVEAAIANVVSPQAADVDRLGVFPRAAIEALREAGTLGLISSTDVGGIGANLAEAAAVVEKVSSACGSTAMVLLMHYAAVSVIEQYGSRGAREGVGSGRHLSTLAFSERGSRSQFWAVMSTATKLEGEISLNAEKSWVTSAAEADSYVWSSRPLDSSASGPMTLWLVPARAEGLTRAESFDGLGLRGNGSVPVTASDARVSPGVRLGEDGAGLDLALTSVLPTFLVLQGAFSLGLMEATVSETLRHLTGTSLDHLGEPLIYQPLIRAQFARMRIQTDTVRALLSDTLLALQFGRDNAMLRVLEMKAVAAESAIAVTDMAMSTCGGAAFRKELGIERRFRDSRAARVMAPTTDALEDFVGRASAGLPLLGPLS